MNLKGKVAIVTGGGKGIGKAISLAFAREGADVVLAARTESSLKEVASEINAMGRMSLVVVTDLANPLHPSIMVDKALDKFGKVDILVNNSGIEGPILNIADMDLEGWNETLAVNLTGIMLCTKYVLSKSMIPRKSGNVINISSGVGRRGMAVRSAYTVTKWGIIGFTQSLAFEVGKYGIRANCITPGAVEGERLDRVLNKSSKTTGIPYEKLVNNITVQTAMGRLVKPGEVAELAVFLASEQSGGITGQTVNCDLGIEMN
jgi:NAD(P)-dependent dehydrogenase (short-subunit alcohol dehydrogenase family)